MRANRSAQTKLLRRQMFIRTGVIWLFYTVAFCLAAWGLNLTIIPMVGEAAANYGSGWIRYDPEDYLERYSADQLVNNFLANFDAAGISYEYDRNDDGTYNVYLDGKPEDVRSIAEKYGIDIIVAEIANGSGPYTVTEGGVIYDNEGNIVTDEATLYDLGTEEAAKALIDISSTSTADEDNAADRGEDQGDGIASNDENLADKEAKIKAAQEDAANVQAEGDGEEADGATSAQATGASNLSGSVTGIVDGNIERVFLNVSPDVLAGFTAREDFRTMASYNGIDNWQVISEDPNGPFSVRDISLYNALKSFKLPLAAVLYIIGCLVIVGMMLRRSLHYFDDLSHAVAGVMTDPEKPVKLPSSLAITQSELNSIRLENLADQRAAAVAEQRKNELVAYLAHDIRTPLTSVIGYLSLLDEADDLPEESRKRYIRSAFAKAERLESLVDEFFEITRYNLQSIPLERRRVNIRLFLEQVADEFYPVAADKNVTITVAADDNAEFLVDADKLARALGNVMRNAVAYAYRDTTVHLVAHRGTLEAPDSHGVEEEGWFIAVTDTGREISRAHLESIFEKFYREDGARSADSGGAGLGLAIAREIVVAHGGRITAASEGGTTVFTLFVPLATR